MRILIYIIVTAAVLSLSSCESWLDIQPKSQVTADNIYSKADGFQAALVGVYLNMSSPKLYGEYMTLLKMEILGQTINPNFSQSLGAPYFYSDELQVYKIHLSNRSSEIETMFDDIWSTAYYAVANNNFLIKKLEAQDADLFESMAVGNGKEVKNIILGEAYALRAYIQFDMMRLFQLPYKSPEGKTSKRVPYVDEYELNLTPSMTSDEIMNKALSDLNVAESLLKDSDPAITGVKINNAFISNNRRHRMNYFAVRALKARIALMKEDYETAYDEAKFIIDNASKMSVRFAVDADMTTKDGTLAIQRSCPMENLFDIYYEKLGDLTNKNFAYSATSADRFIVKKGLANKIYVANDIRRKYWLNPSITASRAQIEKYTTSTLESVIQKYPAPSIALMRLGEMCLIAAEAAANAPSKGGISEAYAKLNLLKTNRGLMVIPESDITAFNAELELEYKRELLGEGQIFFFYKRIYKKVIDHARAEALYPKTIDMTPELYTPDLPQSEIIAGRTY